MTDPYTILRAFVAAYHGDPIADSDLDDEQPRTITVTLGDIRRAERLLGYQGRKDGRLIDVLRECMACMDSLRDFVSEGGSRHMIGAGDAIRDADLALDRAYSAIQQTERT